jgi:hypothetical protein
LRRRGNVCGGVADIDCGGVTAAGTACGVGACFLVTPSSLGCKLEAKDESDESDEQEDVERDTLLNSLVVHSGLSSVKLLLRSGRNGDFGGRVIMGGSLLSGPSRVFVTEASFKNAGFLGVLSFFCCCCENGKRR